MARFFLLAAVLLTSVAVATVVEPEMSASPEPVSDPMFPDFSLVVVPAGLGTSPAKKLLGPTATICPSDYPTGFSIECIAPSRSRFILNGKWQRTEVAAPYYLFGNKDDFVNPWSDMSLKFARVVCKSERKKVVSEVTIAC